MDYGKIWKVAFSIETLTKTMTLIPEGFWFHFFLCPFVKQNLLTPTELSARLPQQEEDQSDG